MRKINTKDGNYLFAVECFQKNNFEKTVELCKKILKYKKNESEVNYLLALALTQLKNYSEALIELDEAFKIAKNKLKLHILKGNIFREIKKYEDALSSFMAALQIDKKSKDALYWTAVTMYQMGQKNSALGIINEAIAISEECKFLTFKARCLDDLHCFKEAISQYDLIINRDNKDVNSLLRKGDLLRRMFEYDLALQYVDKVLELDSKNINAFMLKSVVYKDLQKIEESLQVLDELLIIKPKSEQANFNKSIILLQAGRLRQGWTQYEWRWKIKDWTSLPPQTIKPLWNGEKDGILFLWPEQGIGDEVMFASIFNDLKRDVGKLIVKIDLRLMEIYKRSFPNITFISSKDNLNEYLFDYHLPIGSLPKFYRNELTDFDASNSGFLLTNEIIDKEVKNRLSKYANKRKIGVSWRSKNPLSGLKRSVSLADIIAYINDEEAVFINLQYGDVNEEISELQRSGIEIINISEIDNMKNIDGLLSIINGCDEVVSIDNSTVHFAGAIGKKTQVLMHESADFRWEMQGETTKWYKSLSLKRNIII